MSEAKVRQARFWDEERGPDISLLECAQLGHRVVVRYPVVRGLPDSVRVGVPLCDRCRSIMPGSVLERRPVR